MIRIAQIGVDGPHAAAYRHTLALFPDRIEVVGLVNTRPGRGQVDLGPLIGVPVFASTEQLLDSVEIDAAQVMLRNNEMGPALATLAGEGIHLWAEKPVARRAADLQPAADLIREKDLVFTSGYQSRFQPTTRHAMELIDQGLLGPLTFAHMITATTTSRLRNPDGPNGFIFDPEISGGGIFHWLGCHMIDLLLTITRAQPVSVGAMAATAGEAAVAVEDAITASLRFADGWLASLDYGYLLPTGSPSPFGNDEPEPGIYGQQGWVRWNNNTSVVKSYSAARGAADSPWQRHEFVVPNPGGYGNAAYLAMTNFLNAIEGTEEPAYTIEQAMLVLHIIESAYASSEGRAEVKLDPALTSAYSGAMGPA